MMKNTVVGRPGTTRPIEPTPTATQPAANHSHRASRIAAQSARIARRMRTPSTVGSMSVEAGIASGSRATGSSS